MNKLLFSEGGQPIYLDDLRDLQLMLIEHYRALFDMLGVPAQSGAYLSPEIIRNDFDNVQNVGAGRIFYKDENHAFSCAFEGASFVGEGVTVYVCIDKTTSDSRLFQDGQYRDCRESFSARLSATPSGNFKNFQFLKLKTITTFLKTEIA